MINKLISEEKQKKLKEVKDPYQIRDAYIEAIGEFIIIQVMLIWKTLTWFGNVIKIEFINLWHAIKGTEKENVEEEKVIVEKIEVVEIKKVERF